MPKITLLQKIYGSNKPEDFQEAFNELFKQLKVKTEICGVTPRGWLQIKLSGEDQKFALNYLQKHFGLCPEKLENLTKFSTIRGRITHLGKSKTQLRVDIGIFKPKNIDAVVPLQNLQAQLLDGKKFALQKIIELFGLAENFPLTVEICGAAQENGTISAVLSEQQISTFSNWTETLLDKLLVFGASLPAVEYAVKKSGYARNVVEIETLGFLEHAVTCKLGTQAVGLIPKMGKLLPAALLTVFSPTKIIKLRG
ncbi:hypothetical protein DRO50_00850 [Candidatus Bathyarchaeota archaeon]|nr:MAG: hypothetical protein DRO50_00850 [Candidatus Bathyarchaeota archaeon]